MQSAREVVEERGQALLQLELAKERFEATTTAARQRGLPHDLFSNDPAVYKADGEREAARVRYDTIRERMRDEMPRWHALLARDLVRWVVLAGGR